MKEKMKFVEMCPHVTYWFFYHVKLAFYYYYNYYFLLEK